MKILNVGKTNTTYNNKRDTMSTNQKQYTEAPASQQQVQSMEQQTTPSTLVDAVRELTKIVGSLADENKKMTEKLERAFKAGRF